MKIRYFPATDSLTIDLKDGVGEPSHAEDLTLDGNVCAVYSPEGELVSIAVRGRASELFDLDVVGVAVVGKEKTEIRSFTPLT